MLSGTSPLEESLSEGGCPQGVAPSLPGDTAVEQTLLAAALGSSQNASAVAREGVIPLPLNSWFQLCAAEGAGCVGIGYRGSQGRHCICCKAMMCHRVKGGDRMVEGMGVHAARQ